MSLRAADRADGSMTTENCLLIFATQTRLGVKASFLAGAPSAYLNQEFFRVKRPGRMASGNHKATSSGGKSKLPKLDQR